MDLVVSGRHCCLYRKSRAAKVSLEQRKDKESATAQPFFPSVRLSLTQQHRASPGGQEPSLKNACGSAIFLLCRSPS